MAAADITGDFIRKLKTNGNEAKNVRRAELIGSRIPYVGPVTKGTRWTWFYRRVRNNGPWDFKNKDYKKYQTSGVIICGRQYRNDMPGNFHFGFVGAAVGFLSTVLLRGAGEAQKRAGSSEPEFHCTFGDDPRDHEFIRLGFQLYKKVQLNVDATNLGQALSQFSVITCPAP